MAALDRAAADRDPLVAETAAAARSGSRAADGQAAPYLTVDKVMVLKDVNLFRALPHEVLAGVATMLTDRRVDANQRVFEKGDFGDSLYVIASGRVRVHDGERTLQELGPRAVFGELSLLDAQPRSASVSALEPTHLFRLAQADFYALMSERADITQAINRALCGMVRTANALAAH
jgi:CRP-like cAMP-binding protein